MNSQPEIASAEPEAFFACPYDGCGRLFRTKFSMKRHTLVHNADKNYECKYCHKKFALPQYLREHTYTHTRDRPYVCGVAGCQKRFRQAGKLSLHRRTHKEYVLKQYASHQKDADPQNADETERLEKDEACIQRQDPIKDPEEVKAGPVCKDAAHVEKRVFWRQDSGQTNATLPAREDQGDLFHDECPPKHAQTAKPSAGLALTKEALAEHDRQIRAGDALARFLTYIDTDVFQGLRPILPQPRGRRNGSTFYLAPPDLFELAKKYTKD